MSQVSEKSSSHIPRLAAVLGILAAVVGVVAVSLVLMNLKSQPETAGSQSEETIPQKASPEPVGDGLTGSAPPEWLWVSQNPVDEQVVSFRKTFILQEDVTQALLGATCDDRVTVWINGQQVLQNPTWNEPALGKVTEHLTRGQNVITAQCVNVSGKAAFILILDLTLADGSSKRLVTTPDWQVTESGQFHPWEKNSSFDDWKKPHSFGPLGCFPWNELVLDPKQLLSSEATAVETISVLPDFSVELVHTVPYAEQGSWVALTVDPQGRLIASDEHGSLYRVTIPPFPSGKGSREATPIPGMVTQVQQLSVPIGHAHGLLCAFDSLYVVVNGGRGSGLYRLRDTDNDDQYDRVDTLIQLEGAGEHGPHAVKVDPDGKHLWLLAGNFTDLPEECTPDGPYQKWAEDLLLPRNPDGRGVATGRLAPGGWIARTDPEGKTWEVYCGGLRNPYDMAFNPEGELFTFDADMELDIGAPWYRPTRVQHCLSGGEAGWRFGTGKWPSYYPDTLPSTVDIGRGSPTGIAFGTHAAFPSKYQRALFLNDWTLGKIYAVHLQPQGASYTASFETFLSGRSMPMTATVINPVDRALYFTTGGRKAQSGLYRVVYQGNQSTQSVSAQTEGPAAAARDLRRQLEELHRSRSARASQTAGSNQQQPQSELSSANALEQAWPQLNSRDRAIRHAARIAVEHVPMRLWWQRALQETKTNATITVLVAACRCGDSSHQAEVVNKLAQLPWKRLTQEQMLDALRAYQLALIRLGEPWDNDGTGAPKPSAEVAESIVSVISPLYPSGSERVNRELARLLIFLEAPQAIEHTMALLANAQTQQDQVFYAFLLRTVEEGWTLEQRRDYFAWMNLATQDYLGGSSFPRFLDQIRSEALSKLSVAERTALENVIENGLRLEVVKLETTRQFVHNWQMADLMPLLKEVDQRRDFERGREAYQVTQCAKCHRFAGSGADIGPDLTTVGNRFDNRYLLESLLRPSQVVSDQYLTTIIETEGGEVISGRVIQETAEEIKVRTDPFALELTTIPTSEVADRQLSKSSTMPTGLINVLSKEEILDLLAYLRSGGNPDDPIFR